MTKFCKQGHEQTPENQYKVNDKHRGIRYRCKPCALASKPLKGTPHLITQQIERQQIRLENIEFMLDSQTPHNNIVVRSGYSSERELLAGLKRGGRMDLHLRFKKRKNVLHVRRSRGKDNKTFIG